MTDQHPITPPPELFKQWEDDILNERDNVDHVLDCAWRHGFRTGADQELEACISWIRERPCTWTAEQLRAARRPKPKSLAEEALEALKHAEEGWRPVPADCDIIRRALKRLQELEGQGDG